MLPPVCMPDSALYHQFICTECNLHISPWLPSRFVQQYHQGPCIALPGCLSCTSLARRWDAGTEILSWNFQSTIAQKSQQEGMSTNSSQGACTDSTEQQRTYHFLDQAYMLCIREQIDPSETNRLHCCVARSSRPTMHFHKKKWTDA